MFVRIAVLFAALAALSLPETAAAYVGPGAGLSLLGALWALLIALGTALAFIVAWPLRRMIKRRRAGRLEAEEQAAEELERETSEPPLQSPRRS